MVTDQAVVVTRSDWLASQLRTRRLGWLLTLGGLLIGAIVCLLAMKIAEDYAPNGGVAQWPVAAGLMLLLLLPLAVASQLNTHRQQDRTDQVVGVLTEQLSRSVADAIRQGGQREVQARRREFETRLANAPDMAGGEPEVIDVSLTGLLNRRSFEQQVAQLRQVPSLLTLAVADLDHFKQLNDTYGHETGDRALRLFAQVLAGSVRVKDLACRHGGEEFVIALGGCDTEAARDILDSLRGRLDAALTVAGLPRFTASFGVVQACLEENLPAVINRADAALFQAKRDGRDRVVVHDSVGKPVPSRSEREQTDVYQQNRERHIAAPAITGTA